MPKLFLLNSLNIQEVLDEVVAAKERLKGICTLSTRIQSEIDGYVVEMRLQYPNAQFPSIDAHELTGTIYRLQVSADQFSSRVLFRILQTYSFRKALLNMISYASYQLYIQLCKE